METYTEVNHKHDAHHTDDVETINDNSVEYSIHSYCFDCKCEFIRVSVSIIDD